MSRIYIMTGWQKGFGWKLYNTKVPYIGGDGRLVGISIGSFFLQLEVLP